MPGVAVMTCGALGWLGGRILKAAVSRQREFLADARAVQFTRSKEGLGGVLRKVMGEQASCGKPQGLNSQQRLSPLVHHMLLIGPQVEASWLATHPQLAERVRRIYGRHMPAVEPALEQSADAVF